jgi:hypothetical protein
MAAVSFEHAAGARAALQGIVSDPAHGTDALSNPQTISNLLQDKLPEAVREPGLRVTAASAGLPAMLRDHVSLLGCSWAAGEDRRPCSQRLRTTADGGRRDQPRAGDRRDIGRQAAECSRISYRRPGQSAGSQDRRRPVQVAGASAQSRWPESCILVAAFLVAAGVAAAAVLARPAFPGPDSTNAGNSGHQGQGATTPGSASRGTANSPGPGTDRHGRCHSPETRSRWPMADGRWPMADGRWQWPGLPVGRQPCRPDGGHCGPFLIRLAAPTTWARSASARTASCW